MTFSCRRTNPNKWIELLIIQNVTLSDIDLLIFVIRREKRREFENLFLKDCNNLLYS